MYELASQGMRCPVPNQSTQIYIIYLTPRGRVLPIMAYTGRLRPKGVPFFILQVYETAGITLVEV